jgi:hypothetical protein
MSRFDAGATESASAPALRLQIQVGLEQNRQAPEFAALFCQKTLPDPANYFRCASNHAMTRLQKSTWLAYLQLVGE